MFFITNVINFALSINQEQIYTKLLTLANQKKKKIMSEKINNETPIQEVEKVSANDQFTTIEECVEHIEGQDTYIAELEGEIAELEGEIEKQKKDVEKLEVDSKFYMDFANRQSKKLTLCLQLLKLSDNPLMVSVAQKIEKTYDI